MLISWRRAAACASMRFARFRQAISKVNPARPARTERGLVNWERMSSATPTAADETSRRIERYVWSREPCRVSAVARSTPGQNDWSCARACSMLTPSFNRPIAWLRYWRAGFLQNCGEGSDVTAAHAAPTDTVRQNRRPQWWWNSLLCRRSHRQSARPRSGVRSRYAIRARRSCPLSR
jgi:hypothetical protein